jgi:hypothetical protein
MEIKLTLKQLTVLFARTAGNEEIPVPIRQFAAQLTVLTAHVERVETKLNEFSKEVVATFGILNNQIVKLASLSKAVSQAPTEGPQSAAPAEEEQPTVLSEDDEAEAMAAKVLQETEAEVAALLKEPPTAMVVAPQRKANGGKAPSAGEVA